MLPPAVGQARCAQTADVFVTRRELRIATPSVSHVSTRCFSPPSLHLITPNLKASVSFVMCVCVGA